MRPRRRSRFNFVNGVASAPSGCHQPKMRLRASATDTAAPLPSPSSPLLGLLKARSHLRSGLSGAAAQTLAVEPLLIATRSVPRQAADKADPDRPTSDANDRDVSAEPLLIREATRPWKPRMTWDRFSCIRITPDTLTPAARSASKLAKPKGTGGRRRGRRSGRCLPTIGFVLDGC